MIKHVPNILTICRLIFIPFIILSVYNNNYILAIILFTISSISDILDGIIARKLNLVSNFGKLMDPVADKLTQISIILILSLKKIIPLWILIALTIKEFIMVLGGLFLYKKRDVVVSSKWYGKLTTVLIYMAVVSSFMIKQIPELGFKFSFLWHNVTFDMVIYEIAIAFAVFSLFKYIHFFGKDILSQKVNR